jgi:quinol monooxygenase YgiN
MLEPITQVDVSTIRPGKLDELKEAVAELAAFVHANEESTFSYNFYVDEENNRMTVIQVHPDADSLQHHMEVAGPEFRKFQDLLDIKHIEVYGEPGTRLTQLLRKKADLLGGASLSVLGVTAGFYRFTEATSAR